MSPRKPTFLEVCADGASTTVQIMMNAGYDIHVKDVDGSGAVHKAAGAKNPAEAARTIASLLNDNLVPRGQGKLNVSAKNSADDTPLHVAAGIQGHEVVMDLLLERNADLAAVNKAGQMPWQVAEKAGVKAETVAKLKQAAEQKIAQGNTGPGADNVTQFRSKPDRPKGGGQGRG